MHIALFSPSWPLDQSQNGIVTFVHHMRRQLEALGHRVSVFTSHVHPTSTPDPRVHHVVDDESPLMRKALRWFGRTDTDAVFAWGRRLAAHVMRVHRSEPIDLIEMEESFGWSSDVQRLTGIPVLVKLHGPAFQSLMEEELATPLGQRRVEREGEALGRTRAIAAPSADTLAQAVARYRLEPVICERLSNPIDTGSAWPLWRADAVEPDSLLFVGRFDRRKGGDVMIDAFARVLERRPNARLTLVGPDVGIVQPDGSRVHVEDYAARALPGAKRRQLDLRGRLPNSEIPALRCRASVVVVPSRWENQGYAAVEALLQGCPVVASDSGGLPESVIEGRTGRLARVGDAADLARQILALLDDPAGSALLGEAGRRHVLEEHDAQGIARRSLALYERVIADAGRR